MKLRHLLICVTIVGVLSGCASRLPVQFVHRAPEAKRAVHFYGVLDRHLVDQGNQNALGTRVKGFPYLRTNRFLTGLKPALNLNDRSKPALQDSKKQWIRHLQALDLSARESEIRTLTDTSIQSIFRELGDPDVKHRDDLIAALKKFSSLMLVLDRKNPDFYNTVFQRVVSEDDYSGFLRFMGAYPLAYGPILYFTRRAYDRMDKSHQQDPLQRHPSGDLVHYRCAVKRDFDTQTIGDLFSGTKKDTLGIYRFSQNELETLAAYYAPVYTQDTTGPNDMFGKVIWKQDRVTVNFRDPTVYYYFSHALLDQTPVFQVNYVIWYLSRDGPDVPWFEKGNLDGLTFRVTLDSTGMPMMTDIVHNCGCYHFFVPKRDLISGMKPFATQIGNTTPAWLPKRYPDEQLSIWVSSGWHQVQHIGIDHPASGSKPYVLIPYGVLESLGKKDQRESIFDDKGIVKGSQRIEPYLLFSAGIPEIGAMRQRTRQPTRLIGREHFDNPKIFNNHFEFNRSEPFGVKPSSQQ